MSEITKKLMIIDAVMLIGLIIGEASAIAELAGIIVMDSEIKAKSCPAPAPAQSHQRLHPHQTIHKLAQHTMLYVSSYLYDQ